MYDVNAWDQQIKALEPVIVNCRSESVAETPGNMDEVLTILAGGEGTILNDPWEAVENGGKLFGNPPLIR